MHRLRWPSTLLACALLGVGASACGSGGRSSRTSATAAASKTVVVGDGHLVGDGDGDEQKSNDYDDIGRRYGHAPSAVEKRAITDLIKRYYAVAAAGDGRKACAMIAPGLIRGQSLAEGAIPKEFIPVSGSSVFRHKGCAQIASLIFSIDRQLLAEEVPTLQALSVRIKGSQGLVVLGFRTSPERQMPVERVHGAWRVGAMLDLQIS